MHLRKFSESVPRGCPFSFSTHLASGMALSINGDQLIPTAALHSLPHGGTDSPQLEDSGSAACQALQWGRIFLIPRPCPQPEERRTDPLSSPHPRGTWSPQGGEMSAVSFALGLLMPSTAPLTQPGRLVSSCVPGHPSSPTYIERHTSEVQPLPYDDYTYRLRAFLCRPRSGWNSGSWSVGNTQLLFALYRGQDFSLGIRQTLQKPIQNYCFNPSFHPPWPLKQSRSAPAPTGAVQR